MKNLFQTVFKTHSVKYKIYQNQSPEKGFEEGEKENQPSPESKNEEELKKLVTSGVYETPEGKAILEERNEKVVKEVSVITSQSREAIMEELSGWGEGIEGSVDMSVGGTDNHLTGEMYKTWEIGNQEVYPYVATEHNMQKTNEGIAHTNLTGAGLSTEYSLNPSGSITAAPYIEGGVYTEKYASSPLYKEGYMSAGAELSYAPSDNFSAFISADLPLNSGEGKYEDQILIDTGISGSTTGIGGKDLNFDVNYRGYAGDVLNPEFVKARLLQNLTDNITVGVTGTYQNKKFTPGIGLGISF